MDIVTILDLVADITVVYVWLTITLFVLGYGFFFRWRQTVGGRSIFYFVASLWLVMNLNVTGIWFPNWFGDYRDLLRVASYGLIAVTITRMLLVLIDKWVHRNDLALGVEYRRRPNYDNENSVRS